MCFVGDGCKECQIAAYGLLYFLYNSEYNFDIYAVGHQKIKQEYKLV